jgi:hypothetical protein
MKSSTIATIFPVHGRTAREDLGIPPSDCPHPRRELTPMGFAGQSAHRRKAMRQECNSPFAFRFRKHSVAPNLVDVASGKLQRLRGLDAFPAVTGIG